MNISLLYTYGQSRAVEAASTRMCLGIAVAGSELPRELIGRHGLGRRLHLRGQREEYRFLFRDRHPCLPVWRDGQLQLARWGNGRGRSRILPRTGWTWDASIRAGYWRGTEAILVDIPANYGLEKRGVWFLIETGIRGLLVPDEQGWAVCYMICEPASHYYNYVAFLVMWPSNISQRICNSACIAFSVAVASS